MANRRARAERSATRRHAFTVAAAMTFAGAIARPARAAAFTFKWASSAATDHPSNVRFTEMWERVKKETRGRLEAQGFTNGALGSEAAVLSQLREGAIQFIITDGSLTTVVPVCGIFSMPLAFRSNAVAFASCDGDLGDYVRREIAAKGIVCFPKFMDLGSFREITTSVRPIRTAQDLAGLKIRTPLSRLNQDFYKAMGATATALTFDELYTALQTRLVDGEEAPYLLIEQNRLYEVQKYLSITDHVFSPQWILANADQWTELPPELRTLILREASRAALQERRDCALQTSSLIDKLQRQGMVTNVADQASFRARLGGVYRSWKAEFGATAWDLLERYSGRLT